MGKYGNIYGKQWEIHMNILGKHGKSWEKIGKHRKIMGQSLEHMGTYMENIGQYGDIWETMGKYIMSMWENMGTSTMNGGL